MKRLLGFGILMSVLIHSAGASVLLVFSSGFNFRSEAESSSNPELFEVEWVEVKSEKSSFQPPSFTGLDQALLKENHSLTEQTHLNETRKETSVTESDLESSGSLATENAHFINLGPSLLESGAAGAKAHPYLLRTWKRLQRMHENQKQSLGPILGSQPLEFLVQVTLEPSGKIQGVKVIELQGAGTPEKQRTQRLLTADLISLRSFGPLPKELSNPFDESGRNSSVTLQYRLIF